MCVGVCVCRYIFGLSSSSFGVCVCVCVFMLWRGCEKEGRVKELEVDLSLHNYVGVVVYGLL